jgi:EamA domain-containing membrane protein RarD
MINALLFLDIAPTGGGAIGALFGVGFFLALAGIAFIAYKSLRKTVKWAVRIGIVIAILVIALAGSITLWWYSAGANPRPRTPTPSRSR